MKILAIIIFLVLSRIWASEVNVICPVWQNCVELKKKIKNNMKTSFSKEMELIYLKNFSLDPSVEAFELIGETINGMRFYKLYISLKSRYSSVRVEAPEKIDSDNSLKILNIKSSDFVSEEAISFGLKEVESYLLERGFEGVVIKYELKGKKANPELVVKINYKSIMRIKDVNFEGSYKQLPSNIVLELKKLKNKSYNKMELKIRTNNIRQELISKGFFDAKVKLSNIKLDDGQQKVIFTFDIGQKININFRGNYHVSRDEILKEIRNIILNDGKMLNEKTIVEVIRNLYEKKGVYNSIIKVSNRTGFYKTKINFVNFYVSIIEGYKIRVRKLGFQGNLKLKVDRIEKLYYEKSTTLASRNFLDKPFLKNFTSYLKEYYLRNGHILVNVEEPQISYSKNGKDVEVVYSIKEKQQCILKTFKLNSVPDNISSKILIKLTNKVGRALNVVDLEKDIELIVNSLRELGYYFAEIKNLSESNIITYQSNYTTSHIFLDFNLGKKTIFDSLVINGNGKTLSKIISRENKLKKGEIVSPAKLKAFRDRLTALGIFSRVKITPSITNRVSENEFSKLRLAVQVQEKEFGIGEIAPGYRTDLGAKISFNIAYRNLWGKNHSVSLKTQLNRRLSLGGLDEARKNANHHRIEGLAQLSYAWPYLTRYFDGDISFSFQRKRYASFDADIWKISPKISKDFNDWFSSSVKYQFERIRQFDATELQDAETFKIGSITPAIQFDFRDNPLNPKSGTFFGLSWEFANPFFLSQKSEMTEINFSKVISRNRFYLPLFQKRLVLALSLSAGYQINYANRLKNKSETVGYIPPIKVFRLDGFDVVRGFADSEANRLENGEDINKFRVQNKAFFTNLKFEPRFFLNDTIILGIFYDAGGVYLNSFNPVSLKSAVGATFKFLTPVGTLDFDYGVKIRRRDLNDGGREGFGRFHLSIGFF